MDIKNWGVDKMLDYHECAIKELHKIVNKLSIDVGVLLNEFKNIKELTNGIIDKLEESKKTEKEIFEKMDTIEDRHKKKVWGYLKENAATISAISIPSVGVIGTILYEIGKYLRNLPAP